MRRVLAHIGMGLLYVLLSLLMVGIVLQRGKKSIDAPITYGELFMFIFGVAWYWASFWVGRLAKRWGRSRANWTVAAAIFDPLGVWLLLLFLRWYGSGRQERGSLGPPSGTEARADQTRQHRDGFQLGNQVINKTALRVIIITVVAIVAAGTFWWWTRPAPENFTQQLSRECRETLAYTHPEWGEATLDRMTRGCVEQRLLRAPPR